MAANGSATAAWIGADATDWTTGEDAAVTFFGDFATVRPGVFVNGVVGDSSVSDPSTLQVGTHDPYRNGFSLQGIEFAADLDLGGEPDQGLGGEAIYRVFEDEADDSLDGEFEELYGTLDLPGLRLRGGRYLNAFGFQNDVHLHGWDFVDLPLVYGRLLGDHGLRTEGGSVRIDLPSRWGANLALSFGESVAHDHAHGHGGGHGDHDDHGEHGHDEDHHEDHGHGNEHGHGAGEDLLFDGAFVSGRLLVPWNQDDFHRWSSQASLAVGNNSFDKQTVIYGAGLAYDWFENGYQPGGARFRASFEAFGRSWTAGGGDHGHGHHGEEHGGHGEEHGGHGEEHGHGDHGHEEEHGHHGEDHGHEDHGDHYEEGHGDDHGHRDEHDHGHEGETTGTDFGFLAEAIYSPSFRWDYGGRIEYVSGDSDADLDERWRFSPVVTWWADESKALSLRLQYNLDSLPRGEEHSVWLQVGLAWGAH